MYTKPASQLSTSIKTLYSKGYSALFISFYKANLSFRFMPFVPSPAKGNSPFNYHYDNITAITTTVDYMGAAALWLVAKNILDGKEAAQRAKLTIQCLNNVSLVLERKPGQGGQMETTLTIIKNNITIPFKFNTHQAQVTENGQMFTKIIDSGLGAFAMTIIGYLTGTGIEIHLRKLGDDIEKFQEEMQQDLEKQALAAVQNNNNQQYTNQN